MTNGVRDETPEIRTPEVTFTPRVGRPLRHQRPSIWQYLKTTRLVYLLGAPVIYGMVVPLLVLDAWATVYQHLCFRIYRIPRVRRVDYLVFDRHRLPYLNPIEKLHCLYCSYANQLMAYTREINGRSEQFFCPIKHARPTLDPHHRTARFFDYGDGRAYVQHLDTMRKDWESKGRTSSWEP